MGLTVHYELGLPANMSVARVTEKLEHLRTWCLTKSFAEISEIKHFRGSECDYEKANEDDSWTLIQARHSVLYKYDKNGRARARKTYGKNYGGVHSISVVPERVVAFMVWPGEGCESMEIGLAAYPSRVSVTNESGRMTSLRLPKEWRWSAFCKTQYANDPKAGGVMNFLRCHTLVIAALDEAKRLGLQIEVHDEGGYYKKRDLDDLAREIGEWDALVAKIGGMIKDAVGDGGQIEGPIFDRPDFEHLEMQGR